MVLDAIGIIAPIKKRSKKKIHTLREETKGIIRQSVGFRNEIVKCIRGEKSIAFDYNSFVWIENIFNNVKKKQCVKV